MQKWIYSLGFLFQSVSGAFAYDFHLEDLTYENLAADPWTDHIMIFKQLFDLEAVDSFLEFGLGKGTRFFLDHCSSVTSVELMINSRRHEIKPWYEQCCAVLSTYTNWNASLYDLSPNFDLANQHAKNQLDPEKFDTSYLLEINNLCDQLFKNQTFDLAFVDPGIHIRGDVVNALFNRANIIVAHDTAGTQQQHMYGYYKIKCPHNYEELVSQYGQGTTLWIKKDKKALIKKLKKLPTFN